MKRSLMLLAFLAGTAWGGVHDAAIVTAVAGGGRVLVTDYGFAVTTHDGHRTRAVRQWDGGYWISGPSMNVRLTPRYDGYAIARVYPRPDGTILGPATTSDRFDWYYGTKKIRRR